MLKSVFVLTLLFTNLVSAHGEDKPGPNGGEIRMTGVFHTELKVSGQEIWVYLLDLKFEKPRTDKSSVEVEAILPTDGPTHVKLDCRPAKASEPPRFVCTHDQYEPSKGQVLKVRAIRGRDSGPEVSYGLPLFSKKTLK